MSYQNVNVRSFEKAQSVLGTKESKLIGLNTRIRKNEDGSIGITLHSTEVAKFYQDNKTVELSTGGWNTVTTRERLNRYIPGGFRVWTERGVLFIGNWTGDVPVKKLFVDGGQVVAGELVGFAEVNGKSKEVDKLRNKVKRFSKAYIQALKAGKVPKPGAGDCFYCAMRVTSPEKDKGKTLGEAFHDAMKGEGGHLMEHMKESYFVPSLITRATEVFPTSMVASQCLAAMWASNTTDEIRKEAQGGYFYDIGWKQLEKTLRRYILRQFGIDGR